MSSEVFVPNESILLWSMTINEFKNSFCLAPMYMSLSAQKTAIICIFSVLESVVEVSVLSLLVASASVSVVIRKVAETHHIVSVLVTKVL